MPGLEIMLPIALVIAVGFLAFFLWSVQNGDYDDPEKIKYTVLMDDQDDIDTSITPKAAKAGGKHDA